MHMEELPLYHGRHFLFRFEEDRLIPRFHLAGVEPGRAVSVFNLESDPTDWRTLLTTAVVGEGGWVDLAQPILVRAGQGFVVVPDAPRGEYKALP
jgi:hypothetical protein